MVEQIHLGKDLEHIEAMYHLTADYKVLSSF